MKLISHLLTELVSVLNFAAVRVGLAAESLTSKTLFVQFGNNVFNLKSNPRIEGKRSPSKVESPRLRLLLVCSAFNFWELPMAFLIIYYMLIVPDVAETIFFPSKTS